MTYRKAAREGLSYGFIGSMHKMMTLDVHFPGICVWVDKQTNIHAHRNTLLFFILGAE